MRIKRWKSLFIEHFSKTKSDKVLHKTTQVIKSSGFFFFFQKKIDEKQYSAEKKVKNGEKRKFSSKPKPYLMPIILDVQ